MNGRPLAEALRCAHWVVDRMRPVDSVGLVSFDDKVRQLWPAVPVGDGKALHAAIETIHAGGSTDLHGGWQAGADALESVTGNGVRCVMLLSDGQANVGLTDTAEITAQCVARAAKGITTSTFGLSDHFNEELMVAMAKAGGGNHYYGDTADDLMEPFKQELALLGNLFLRGVGLQVQPEPGVSVRMLNVLLVAADGWTLPDLAWGAEAWAVLRLTMIYSSRDESSADLGAAGRRLRLARVSVSGQDPDGVRSGTVSQDLSLPVLPRTLFDALPSDELVVRRLVELEAAASLDRMRAAARAGDWARVDRLLAEATQRFRCNAWVQAMLETMRAIAASREQARMMKEALYSSVRLNRRLAEKAEAVALDAVAAEALPAFLRRKRA